jgi:hypothetical protein
MRATIGTLLGLAAICGAAAFAEAQDEKPQVNAAALLINNVLRQPVDQQQRQLAFDESLRHDGPAPRRALVGEVQPDGSVKYGNVTVSTLKNPCPPGEHVELLPPVPLRRASR